MEEREKYFLSDCNNNDNKETRPTSHERDELMKRLILIVPSPPLPPPSLFLSCESELGIRKRCALLVTLDKTSENI